MAISQKLGVELQCNSENIEQLIPFSYVFEKIACHLESWVLNKYTESSTWLLKNCLLQNDDMKTK